MINKPKASILINSYNYADYLRDAIESALSQDYENFEVVVTDDGSTDGSREIIRSFTPRIKALYKDNGGQASAFNSGVKHSTGDILFLLDADDTSDRQRLSKVVEQYQAHADAEWVFHQLRRVSRDGVTPISAPPSAVIQRFDQRKKDFKFPALSTSGLSFRRSLASKLFPMPEAPGCLIHDNYLKFAAVLLATGVYMGSALGSLRIHGRNDTSAGQPLPTKLHGDMLTALELHRHHPELTYWTNKLASGTAASAWTWGDGGTPVKRLFEQYLRSLPYVSRGEMIAGTALRVLRNHVVGPTERTHGTILPTRSQGVSTDVPAGP